MLALAALVALGILVGHVAIDFDHRAVHWPLMILYGLLAAPLLTVVRLARSRDRKPWARALASAVGLVGGIPLGIFGTVLAVFIGFSMSSLEFQRNLLTIAFCAAVVALGLVGIGSMMRAPAADRHGKALAIAVLIMASYAGAVLVYANTVLGVPYDSSALIAAHNERSAKRTLARLSDCAERARYARPTLGYPARLADFAGATGCTGGELMESGGTHEVLVAEDYGFVYYAAPADASGKRDRYVVCAYPRGRDESGQRVFTRDSTGTRRDGPRPGPDAPPACARTWAGNGAGGYLRALEACLFQYAAEDPRCGYPPSLRHGHMDIRDFDCPGYGLAGTAAGGRDLSDFGAVEYVAGIPGPDAVIHGFDLLVWDRSRTHGAWQLLADGSVVADALPEVPTDPDALERARPLQGVLAAQFDAERARLTARCVTGELALCDHLAYLHWERSEPEAAFTLWERACERGHDASCLLSGRYNPLPYDQLSERERCGRGERRYCDRLAELAQSQRASIRALVARGGHPSARMTWDSTADPESPD